MWGSQEKAELLRRWISSGENLAACESTITASRRNRLTGKRLVKKIAVKDMRVAPYNFSEILVGILHGLNCDLGTSGFN